jgi:hypothetical protein
MYFTCFSISGRIKIPFFADFAPKVTRKTHKLLHPFMFISTHSESDTELIKRSLLNEVKGIEVDDLIIKEVIIGRLCYQLFDNMYSLQYKPLVEKYKIKTYSGRILYDKDQEESNTTEELDLNTINSNVAK